LANIFQKSVQWLYGRPVKVDSQNTSIVRSNNSFSLTSDIERLSKVLGISLSGVTVTEKNALNVPAVLACLEVRNNNIASVPLRVYKYINNKGAVIDEAHPLDYALNVRPNRYDTPFILRKTLGLHRDIWGWGVAHIQRDQYRNVTGLRVLQPNEYSLYETMSIPLGKQEYTLVESDGTIHEEEDLIIWKGITTDGFHCRGIVGCLKEVIKTGLTTREFINKYYQNGTFLGGVLTSETSMAPDQRDANKKSWQDAHGGSDNAGKVAVLSGGLKFQPIANTLVDSQLVEFLSLDKNEIYQAFGVPPHLVGDTTKQTSFGSGLESQTTGFYTLALRPAAVQLEQEIAYKCLRTSEQKRRYVWHDFNALLRADMKTRYDAYAVALQNGWMSPNDIRELEDMTLPPCHYNFQCYTRELTPEERAQWIIENWYETGMEYEIILEEIKIKSKTLYLDTF